MLLVAETGIETQLGSLIIGNASSAGQPCCASLPLVNRDLYLIPATKLHVLSTPTRQITFPEASHLH